MSERIRTVCVHREGGRGHHIINEADFDPDVHELYVEGVESGQADQPTQQAPRPRGRPPGSRNKSDGGAA